MMELPSFVTDTASPNEYDPEWAACMADPVSRVRLSIVPTHESYQLMNRPMCFWPVSVIDTNEVARQERIIRIWQEAVRDDLVRIFASSKFNRPLPTEFV